MPQLASSDGVVISQEGMGVRARAGDLDFLFANSQAANILEAYETCSAQARQLFEPRWRSIRGANIDALSFGALIQESTLNWMYFRINNWLPLQISDRDWDHPQTRCIVEMAVERTFSHGSSEAAEVCAKLMGLSGEDYRAWSDSAEWRRGIM